MGLMANEKHTVKQHYVPRAFLERWSFDGGQVYPIKIVAKVPPNLEILKKTGVYPFCHENYFYANKQGKKDEFSQIVENNFTEVENDMYATLTSFERKVLNNEQITFDDKYHLASIMLFLHMRGKKHLEWSKKFSNEMTREMFGMTLRAKKDSEFDELGITKEEALEMNESMTVDLGMTHHLQQLKNIQESAFYIANKYWKINISKKGEFIVTDAPYLDLPVKQVGWYGNDIYDRDQIFMLSPKVRISIMKPTNLKAKNINRKDITDDTNNIDHLNLISLMNSVLFGFHSDEKVLERTKQMVYKVYQYKISTGYIPTKNET